MKNIAIIITKLNGGGAERCASNLSIELSRHYNVFVIVFDSENVTYPYKGSLINLNIPKSDGGIRRYINVLKRTYMLKKIKKEHKIDVAISLLDGPNLVNALSKGDEKVIVSIRNFISKEPMSPIRRFLVKYSSKVADLTVSLSEVVRRDLINNFGMKSNKVITIYNHVDFNLLRRQAIECNLDFDKSKKYIVTMGRLSIQKGHWHLLRAFREVVKKHPELNLIILGEGELYSTLKKLSSDLGIEKNVIMPGYIKSPHSIFSQCEFFVFSSLFEGLGNVLLEATAFSLPIISTDCVAGPREILAPNSNLVKQTCEVEIAEYGILVPVDSSLEISANLPLSNEEECLTNAMLRMYEDENLKKLYVQKSALSASRFDKDRIIQDWINIIG